MIKARASGSKVYLYFMKKGRQARHRIPWNSCYSVGIIGRNVNFGSCFLIELCFVTVLQIRRNKKDNLGIIFHNTPSKLCCDPS